MKKANILVILLLLISTLFFIMDYIDKNIPENSYHNPSIDINKSNEKIKIIDTWNVSEINKTVQYNNLSVNNSILIADVSL